METTKKTRSRSKSNSISTENVQTTNIEEKTVEETTTNLNGDNSELKDADNVESKNPEKKDSEIEPVIEDTLKESVMMDDKDEKQQPKQPEPVTKGKAAKTRKRKASEMKSADDVDESTKEKKSSSEAVDETIEPENETLETSDVSEPKEKVSEIPEPTGQNESEFKSDMSKVFTNDDVMSESDISQLTPKQTLGKGKRARVPNKRYSDILISPPNKSKVENGSDLEPAVTPISEDLAVVTEKITIKPSAPGTTVAYKKTKAPTDITNPNFLKPFQFGWKRELVWRATFDIQSPKRSGDVYYYTPQGKKVRSMREVMESLKTKELTIEDFTFAKEPLGLDDPEKEIIRDAKFKGGLSLAKKIVAKKAATAAKAHSPKVSSPKVASPKITSPKVNTPKSTPVETTESPPPKNSRANAKLSGNFKIKLPAKKAEKRKSEEEPEPEATPAKSSPATAPNTRRSNKWTKPVPDVTPKTKKRLTKVNNSVVVSEKTTENKFMDHYLQNLSYGYNTLLYVFQYLKVQDLLRAGCVCTMWRDMASHALLWRTVRMKNSQVHSFDGLANSLRKHGTIHLDLRKMLLPSGGDEIWPQFSKAIERVDTLRKIELCRCPAAVVEQLAVSNPHLEVINAVTIKCESMSLEPFASLKTIKELRLKSTSGLTLTSNIDSLKELTTLKHLSLTSIRDLHMMNLGVIAELISLESLDLGECSDFPKNFGEDILVKLDNLEKLRLEKGQGNCHTFEILDAVKNMKRLEQLELVNFDIKAGFDKALGACFNIKKLLIIPTYISQSATTNHMVLGGVLRLYKTLSHFVWGVTLELLRVTELFVDQCEEPLVKDKKEKKPSGNGDSIPVLKPVPLITEKENEIPPAFEPPQVEILPLPNLQKLLLQSLPTTRVKILKIPFHATWRQSITDSVN